MKKILISIGTRPNMIKVTQFKRVAKELGGIEVEIVHTGQHYDHAMADVFFEQFDLKPDHRLALIKDHPLDQIAEMMSKLGNLIHELTPDIVLTPGDVNSTFAAAFAAHKLGVKVGHIESGLRSFDRTMPEEINRILTDRITDLFFVTEQSALYNLKHEGTLEEQVHFVGNTMIDTLIAFDEQIEAADALSNYDLQRNEYILLTFHRPGNVDSIENQQRLFDVIKSITKFRECIFPIHPRAKKAFEASGFWKQLETLNSLTITPPLGYFEFQKLVKYAFAVITDSGGIQEETTFRRVPCITLRPNTERPVTIDIGSNVLLSFDAEIILNHLKHIESGVMKPSIVPPLWDGLSTERILKIIKVL